jgi:hypothetical protein
MEAARLTGGAAPTFLPATAGRAGSRLAYEPSAGSGRAAGSGPGEHLVPGRRRRRTRQPGPWSLADVALLAPVRPAPRPARELSQQTPA